MAAMDSVPTSSRYPEEQTSSSQDGVCKENSSSETQTASPVEGPRPPEKKPHHPSSRSSTAGSSHQRSSHSLDKCVQSSSGIGALDMHPSVFGRSGSSVSSMTVPIRLDALSYLLNNAIMGACKMLPQMPLYSGQYHLNGCQTCPYTQVSCAPYNPCMMQQPGPLPCYNQCPISQQGYISSVNQPGIQTILSQPQSSNFLHGMSNTIGGQNRATLPTYPSQNVINWNSVEANSAQDNARRLLPESNDRDGRSNDRSSSNLYNSCSAQGESCTSSMQRRFGRYGEKQDGDSWPGSQQREFGRGSGRGRGEFRGRPWQGSSRGQEKDWRFGDRTRNTDFGSQKRGYESPDRSPSKGQGFKRGLWSGGVGSGGDSRKNSSWPQRNQQTSTRVNINSTQDRLSSGKETPVQTQTENTDAGDEDWETEYKEVTHVMANDSSDQRQLNVSPSLSTTSNLEMTNQSAENDDCIPEQTSLPNIEEEPKLSDSFQEGHTKDLVKVMEIFVSDVGLKKEIEDQELISHPVDIETIDSKLSTEEREPLSPQSVSSTVTIPVEESFSNVEKVKSSAIENDVFALVLSVEGEDGKEIVLELVDENNNTM